MNSALFWEVAAFGVTHLAALVWMLADLKRGQKDHERRISAMEPSLSDVRERVSFLEGGKR